MKKKLFFIDCKFSSLPLIIRKFFTLSGKFKEYSGFATVWKVWKVYRQSGNTGWKLFTQYGKCPDSLESVLTVWKVSVQSGKCLDSLECVWTLQLV